MFFATLTTTRNAVCSTVRTRVESPRCHNLCISRLYNHTWIRVAPCKHDRNTYSSGINSFMYSGTGSFKPRCSTWQYLQQPIPVLLLIHFVSNSRQMAQNTVGPVHFNQVLMDNGCWHTLIKMLDLTALLTKDRIEPLALPELFAGEAGASGKPSCDLAASMGMIHSSSSRYDHTGPLER